MLVKSRTKSTFLPVSLDVIRTMNLFAVMPFCPVCGTKLFSEEKRPVLEFVKPFA